MKSIFASVICWLVLVHHGFAVPERIPPDVFKAQRDGYLYADYPGVFDDIEDGITIEAWIYLDKPPGDREGDFDRNGNWLIFGKPGSYYVNISGRNLAEERDRPVGSAIIRFGFEIQSQADQWGGISHGWGVPPGSYRRWIHVALQIRVTQDGIYFTPFFNQRQGGGGNLHSIGRLDSPLTIGGTDLKSNYRGWKSFESMEGSIDQLRVSKGSRYGRDDRYQPERYFQVDDRTIALWNFEEGPGAHLYRDSSGNDYHLFTGGSLAVDSRGKLATTWGSLKR